ncbi:MAG: IS21-like element helper ATPase IstB [Pseudomonadota bacterium]|jgi:DNA replication protein DnaC
MSATLAQQYAALGLRATAARLDELASEATRDQWTPQELLERVARLEADDRSHRSLERRTKRSRLGRFKPMADFDWTWPKQIDRTRVEQLLRLDFLREARNVALLAAAGLGKSMIAQNLAHEALRAGHTVVFATASQLLFDLSSRDSSAALDRRLRRYARAGLLVIDELGYLSYDSRSADLLFQLINLRYEKRSTVITSNLAFSEWGSVFPNAACTTALIERVIHHCDIVTIEGESYRLREAKADASRRAAGSRKSVS